MVEKTETHGGKTTTPEQTEITPTNFVWLGALAAVLTVDAAIVANRVFEVIQNIH